MDNNNKDTQKAYSYYKDEMYKKNKGMEGLFSKTQEIYNPVPKIVANMQDFTMKGFGIDSSKNLNKKYEESNSINGYHALIKAIVKRVVLYEETYVEVIPTTEGEHISIVDKDKIVSIKESNGVIKYAKIKGKTTEGEELVREHYNGKYKGINGSEENKIGYITTVSGKADAFVKSDSIRLIHIPKCYALSPIFNKIDRINEFEYFIYAMGRANGDPKLFGKQLTEITEDIKEEFKKLKDKYNLSEKIILTDEKEAELKYIELTGVIIPHFQKQINEMKEAILQDFPEYSVTKAMLGSNVSEETTKTRVLEAAAKVDNIRDEIQEAFKKVFKIIFKSDKLKISFEELFKESADTVIDRYSKLLSLGCISLTTFQEELEKIGIIKNLKEEQTRLKGENEITDPYSNLPKE